MPVALKVSFPRGRILHPDGSVVRTGNGVEPDVLIEPDASGLPAFEVAEALIRQMIEERETGR